MWLLRLAFLISICCAAAGCVSLETKDLGAGLNASAPGTDDFVKRELADRGI